MKKKIFVLFFLLASAFAFAKSSSDKVLDFISNLYSKKIPYTTESFIKQGFVATSSHGTGYETIWNNQYISIFVIIEDKNAQFYFSQNPPLSINVSTGEANYKPVKPDRQKYLSDWNEFINYFLDNYKLISCNDNIYRFKNFKIVNNPDDCSFFIMDYALED